MSKLLKLRASTKNLLVTYSAVQKIFKSRFEEMRANTRLGDFAFSYNYIPLITAPKVHYEGLLRKNKETFFKPSLFILDKLSYFNTTANSFYMSTSFPFNTDFPFLMALRSDTARHIWVD